MYSQTLRIHSARPLPTPTAQRKNATLLRQVANFVMQSVGGHAKAQSFDSLTNASPAVRAYQTADFSSVALDDPGGVGYLGTGMGDVRVVGLATATLTATAWVAAIPTASTAILRKLIQGSNTRGSFAVTTFSTGEKVGVGQWQFTAVRGTPAEYGQFSIGSTDDEGATSLALAINRHPGCSTYFQALASSTTVYVWRMSVPPVGGSRLVATQGKHTTTQLAASAVAVTRLAERTTLGNFVGLSAVGAVSLGGSYLVGGAGDDVSQQTGIP